MASSIDKLTKAKTMLILGHPFFAIIACRLDYVECDILPDGRKCETMATDMQRIYYSPDFVDKLTVSEVAAVIMHECLHVAWLHGLRRGPRDPLLWNFATDYAINTVVKDAGGKLPGKPVSHNNPANKDEKGYLYDEKYRDWSAATIYEDLLKNAPKQKQIMIRLQGDGGGEDGDKDGSSPLWGEVLDAQGEDGKPLSADEKAELEEEVKIAVRQAAESAKARGKLPGSLTGLIEAAGKPKVNWREYIQNWVSGRVPDNYTWVRPNRKMMANYGVYMPRMQLNGAGVGVLSIDTSGSVSDRELKDYVREIAGVIEICSPDKLYIIQHDAVIQDVYEWNAGDDFDKLAIKGRGGTCIQPSFKQAEKFDEPIDWMICFTDMEIGDWPRQAPDFPVLWCATGNDNAPFGTYIDLREAL